VAELLYANLGRRPYGPVLELQRRLVERALAEPRWQPRLLLVEHDPPAITLGRGAKAEHVLASAEELAAAGVEVHHVRRGGDVTVHGPGQLVGYPILRLDADGAGVRGYLRDLEEALIRLLGRFGVAGERAPGLTGVWVAREKVAAIGVAVRRWVTYHGFALNVCPDLSLFGRIVPCGIRGRGVTSLSRLLGREVSVGEVAAPLAACAAEVFGLAGARAVGEEELAARGP